jgi:hypothetical protein
MRPPPLVISLGASDARGQPAPQTAVLAASVNRSTAFSIEPRETGPGR